MAEMLKMSLKAYSNLELGKNDINSTRLNQIAEILGVKLEDLTSKQDPFANFFENCNNPSVNATSSTFHNTINNHEKLEQKNHELHFELRAERAEKETLKIKVEKAEFEATHWREKYEQLLAKYEN
jgi:transcriptional regulator with XRE-family HTH domain